MVNKQNPDDPARVRYRVFIAIANRGHRHIRPPQGIRSGFDIGIWVIFFGQ